jgi:hypothetical protein
MSSNVDIQTLRKYRARGAVLYPDEKIRLCQDDTRRLKEVRKWLYRIAWAAIVLAVILLVKVGGEIVRGYPAIGSEILVPVAAMFAYWIRLEDKAEREGEQRDDH